MQAGRLIETRTLRAMVEIPFTAALADTYSYAMGAGRGRRRRVWSASGEGSPGRFGLDALPSRKPPYARYAEILWARTSEGTEFGWYLVDEYARSGNPASAKRYSVIVEESEAFWVVSARRLPSQSPEPDTPSIAGASTVRGTYRSVWKGKGLREHQHRECIVYAVEHQLNKYGILAPSRCGVRFVGDDSYWVVPAIEVDVGTLAVAP
jgi:hypothetical protein